MQKYIEKSHDRVPDFSLVLILVWSQILRQKQVMFCHTIVDCFNDVVFAQLK